MDDPQCPTSAFSRTAAAKQVRGFNNTSYVWAFFCMHCITNATLHAHDDPLSHSHVI